MNVLLVGIMAVFIALSPAWAQGDQTGVPWSQLSPGEQQLLQRFSDNWDQLPRANSNGCGMGRGSGAR